MGRTKQFQKDEVLAKAIHLFWEKGYEKTSLKELLDEMGILNGSFYHTYRNKKTLFIAALKFYEQDFSEKRVALFQMEKGFKEKIRILFNHVFDRQQEGVCPRGCFLFNSVSAESVKEPEMYQLVRSGVENFERFLEDEIRKALQKQEIDAQVDPKATAAILIAYCQGMMKLSVLDYDDVKFRSQTDYFLNSLGL